MTRWWEYVQRVTRGASQSDIARRLQLNPASVSRWQHADPKPSSVRAFAQSYSRPVSEALIAAGYMEPEDLDRPHPPDIPRPVFDDETERKIEAATVLTDEEKRELLLLIRMRRQVDYQQSQSTGESRVAG